MMVDKPKSVGGFQLAQLKEPDDRTSFAEVVEGSMISGSKTAYDLMYNSFTEPGALAPLHEIHCDLPKSFAPCDDYSD